MHEQSVQDLYDIMKRINEEDGIENILMESLKSS